MFFFIHFRTECERVKYEVSNVKDIEMELALRQLELDKKQEMRIIQDKWEIQQKEMEEEVNDWLILMAC